jgi:hypothetical protein
MGRGNRKWFPRIMRHGLLPPVLNASGFWAIMRCSAFMAGLWWATGSGHDGDRPAFNALGGRVIFWRRQLFTGDLAHIYKQSGSRGHQ